MCLRREGLQHSCGKHQCWHRPHPPVTACYLREKTLLKRDISTLPSFQFWGLFVTLSGLFFFGGASRTDVQSLAILNPMMILCCGAAMVTVRQEHYRDKKYVLGTTVLIMFLVLLYLVPWPAAFGSISDGATSLRAIRTATGILDASAPVAAWQSFFVLFGPLAVILFAIQLKRDDLLLTLPMIIFFGAISGVLGVLQLVGGSDGPLYLYRITNQGSAVGLFANRNHAAVLLACLFPMLAVFATRSHAARKDELNKQQIAAVAVAIVLVPLILVTGSRAGMLVAIVGLLGGVMLYRTQISARSKAAQTKSFVPILAVSIMVSLVFATIYFSRAEAIDRMFADPSTTQLRAGYWVSSLDLFWKYFPTGFGPGSFVAAFQVDEPVALLKGTYLNRLHNDWLETVLTFGLPGILLLLSGSLYYFYRSFMLWFKMNGARRAVTMGRMASVIIAILAVASMSDYPLRTPAMLGLAALVVLWFVEARREPRVIRQGASHRNVPTS
jgi:O-Antigen ligase